eukprot:gene3776-13070_t
MIIFKVLFLLFTCPCCFVNRSRASREEIHKASLGTAVGQWLAFAVIAAGCGLLAWYIVDTVRNSDRDLAKIFATTMQARAQGYLIGWVLQFSLNFNPFIAWGQPDPNGAGLVGT